MNATADPALIHKYRAYRCLQLRPFEVVKLLTAEGIALETMRDAVGDLSDNTWDRLDLLIGLWLRRPGLEGLASTALKLGIHPVSLPLHLPQTVASHPSLTQHASPGVLAARRNELVLALANTLNARRALDGLLGNCGPMVLNGALERAGPGSSAVLQPGLKYRHSVSLSQDTYLRNLPEGLEVGGSLHVDDCPALRTIAEDLRVGSGLRLDRVQELRQLPQTLSVGGSLEVSGPWHLEAWPRVISCGGNLRFEADLALLGELDRLEVGGSARIRAYNLVSLPQGTRIGGSLHLQDCRDLITLPKDLQVGGNLVIRGCPALADPGPDVQVGGTIRRS